jgi:hypothetical protein
MTRRRSHGSWSVRYRRPSSLPFTSWFTLDRVCTLSSQGLVHILLGTARRRHKLSVNESVQTWILQTTRLAYNDQPRFVSDLPSVPDPLRPYKPTITAQFTGQPNLQKALNWQPRTHTYSRKNSISAAFLRSSIRTMNAGVWCDPS